MGVWNFAEWSRAQRGPEAGRLQDRAHRVAIELGERGPLMRRKDLLFVTVQANDQRLQCSPRPAMDGHDLPAARRSEHHFRVVLVDEQRLPKAHVVADIHLETRLQADEVHGDQRNPANRVRIFDALLGSP